MRTRTWLIAVSCLVLFVAVACQQEPPPQTASGRTPPGASVVPGPPGSARPGARTSFDSILAAEKAGKIDHDTALVSLLLAAYAPERLPPELSGPPPSGRFDMTAVVSEIVPRRARMTPALQATVRPFLLRPTNPESFWAPRPPAPGKSSGTRCQESFTDDPAGNVRFWYCADTAQDADEARTTAKTLRDHATSLHAYQQESDAMLGHKLVSDAGTPDDGMSAALDVYIVPHGNQATRQRDRSTSGAAIGLTVPICKEEPCPTPCPSYIILDDNSNLDANFFHELFHAYQFTFQGTSLRDWFSEASAVWAEDLVDPRGNSEWEYLGDGTLWSFPGAHTAGEGGALDPLDGPLDAGGSRIPYGAYLWPFFLTHVMDGGTTTTIGTIWNGRGQASSALAAIQSALPNFDDAFKRFALVNWNDDVDDAKKYQDYDKNHLYMAPMGKELISQKAVEYSISKPDPSHDSSLNVPVAVPHTAVSYIRLTVADANQSSHVYVPQVTLDLSGITSHVSVQAIVKTTTSGNGLKVEYQDWGGATQKQFCRDKEDQNIQSVLLIVANANVDSSGGDLNTQIKVKATGPCTPSKGNFTYMASATVHHGTAAECVKQRKQLDDNLTQSSSSGSSSHVTTVTGDISYGENVTSQWKLTPIQDVTDPAKKQRVVTYEIDSGNQITLSGTGNFEDKLHVEAHGQSIAGGPSSMQQDTDERTSFNNNAGGTSCNGPQPPSGGQGPHWSCPPGGPPPGQGFIGRDGNGDAGTLVLRFPQSGQPTYEIHWQTAGQPMQSTCTTDSSSKSSDGHNSSSSYRYDPTSNTEQTTNNGKAGPPRPRPKKPAAYAGNAMADGVTFWTGKFSGDQRGGDIDVSSQRNSNTCTDHTSYIGMLAPPCDYQQGGLCDTCSYSSSIQLHIHVDVPQQGQPSPSPPSGVGPSSDPCADLAACCTNLSTTVQALQGACVTVSAMKRAQACESMLKSLRSKQLCP